MFEDKTMAKKNEKIVEDLIKDTTNYKSEISEHDENVEFQDALGPSGENTPYVSSDESDCDVVTNSEEIQLSKEEIEVSCRVVLAMV